MRFNKTLFVKNDVYMLEENMLNDDSTISCWFSKTIIKLFTWSEQQIKITYEQENGMKHHITWSKKEKKSTIIKEFRCGKKDYIKSSYIVSHKLKFMPSWSSSWSYLDWELPNLTSYSLTKDKANYLPFESEASLIIEENNKLKQYYSYSSI